jgi:hypothetical protein
MGTRRRNRPVSAAVANGPLAPDTGRTGARSAGPCARDPPWRSSVSYPALPTDRERAMANPPGEEPPSPTAKKERRCSNIASPKLRTREASPSYSWQHYLEIHSLPTPGPRHLEGPDNRDRSTARNPQSLARSGMHPTANPYGAKHACPA